MKRVSYCGESFLTTNEGADALLHLVAAFADHDESEMVEMPAVQTDGKAVTVHMIVGSRSELISIPEDGRLTEPDTTEVVAQLRDRTRSLSAPSEEDYSDACSSMEYGWDEIYAL